MRKTSPIEQLVKELEKLKELSGIGDRMLEHLQEIVKTSDYALRKKLLKKYPTTDLLRLGSS
jgi:DNA polymerase/3'-5' exonuclease PolX